MAKIESFAALQATALHNISDAVQRVRAFGYENVEAGDFYVCPSDFEEKPMGMDSVSDFQIPFDFSDNFELKGLIDLFTSDAYQEFLPDPVERELDYAVIVFENDEFSCAFAESKEGGN